MEMKKQINNGFTLVELLAVIVILAIILAIAIPGISGIIKSATKGAFESDAKMVLQQLEYEKLEDDTYDVTTVDANNITDLKLSNANYDELVVGLVDNKPYIIITGKNKWANLKACGSIRNMTVVASDDTTTCEDINVNPVGYNQAEGVNRPVLTTGMTAKKWNGTSWVTVSNPDTDTTWYDYTNKEWANAQTADGSMWVWIPRYAYQIATNYHTNTTGTINVKFLKGTTNTASDGSAITTTPTYSGSSQTNYIVQPAFTFGTTEIPGMWVAKFEASGTTSAIDIKPNVTSLRSTTIDSMFTATRNMETNSRYGWGTSGTGIDTHLMKNTEWGVVAYLSKSVYGQNTNEIWINPANDYTTGCSGDSVSSAATTGCLRTYETANGVKASTTGNIYGIYDMSGGAWEYTSAYVNNGHGNLGLGSTITGAAAQYKDVYTVGGTDDQATNYGLTISEKGDAIYETSNNINGAFSWFSDYSYMPNTSGPWFERGGSCAGTASAGAFNFGGDTGGAGSNIGFRPVALVGAGL